MALRNKDISGLEKEKHGERELNIIRGDVQNKLKGVFSRGLKVQHSDSDVVLQKCSHISKFYVSYI